MEESMLWLQRNAWWLLLTMTVLVAVIGLNPVINGIKEDASVPLGITGLSASELQAQSAQGYRLIDMEVRSGGLDLIIIGVLLSAVVLFGVPAGPAMGLVGDVDPSPAGRLRSSS
jgi:hypothetical protein